MKTNGKGISLIEVLTAIILVSAVAAMAAPLYTSMVQGLGRGTRTVQADRTVWHLLDRLRQDVRGARAVALAGRPGEAVELGLGRDKIEVHYGIADGNVIRTAAGGNRQACWAVPDATIELRLWPAEGPPRALEVRTSVAEIVNSVTRQKLSRTHLLFFDGIEGKGDK